MEDALSALQKDPHFKPLIKKYGAPKLSRGKTPFQALCRAIIYQQISGKAAASIYTKFLALFGITLQTPIDWESRAAQRFPKPDAILAMPEARLRGAGLSTQKISYLKDLARNFSSNTVPHRKLHRMSNEEIIKSLIVVKGIGMWTIHMFLIFTLNRPNILPTGDLGVRKGFQVLYNLKSLPSVRTMERLARPWREHASAASWYLWRVADESK
jgi:DNA-3-methyladenine glycosylase II